MPTSLLLSLIFSSLNDSSDFIIPATIIMSKQKFAISHTMVTRLPELSNGKISPKLVRDFKNHCLNYFINAKGRVDKDLKVSCILGCFKNNLVNDWISINCEHFTALPFPNFMAEFHSQWLPHDWEQTVDMT